MVVHTQTEVTDIYPAMLWIQASIILSLLLLRVSCCQTQSKDNWASMLMRRLWTVAPNSVPFRNVTMHQPFVAGLSTPLNKHVKHVTVPFDCKQALWWMLNEALKSCFVFF